MDGAEKKKIALTKDEWNHVLISHEGEIYGMGVHVYKEESLDNVRFINHNPLNRTFTNKRKLDCRFSLSKKFCPFLEKEVCDTTNLSEEMDILLPS